MCFHQCLGVLACGDLLGPHHWLVYEAFRFGKWKKSHSRFKELFSNHHTSISLFELVGSFWHLISDRKLSLCDISVQRNSSAYRAKEDGNSFLFEWNPTSAIRHQCYSDVSQQFHILERRRLIDHPFLISETNKSVGLSVTVMFVEAVVAAEFDIDKGSTVRHQVPAPIGVSESFLAESMLPEGGHLRETDWTYFFIRASVSLSSLRTHLTFQGLQEILFRSQEWHCSRRCWTKADSYSKETEMSSETCRDCFRIQGESQRVHIWYFEWSELGFSLYGFLIW